MSLRNQVAFIIALLSLLPNLIMLLSFLLPVNRRIENHVWHLLLIWIFIISLFSVGIGYLLAKQLFKPLTKLTKQLHFLRVNTKWLNNTLIIPEQNTPAEIEALNYAFNNLLERIHTEQSRRSAFMATVMHDLKTPLVAANNILLIIRDNDHLSKEERVLFVTQLMDENKALIDLVQKMVQAYKFEREDVPLNKKVCNLATLVQKVFERVQPLAKEKQIKLTLKGKASAEVDAKELTRALYNLISNAVRYTKSCIKVELFSGLIRLSDDGPGLPAPLENLAQPFNAQPVIIAGKTFTAGTGGLGLFIAKRIIEAHGGRLVTESSSSQGTVLLIYLKTAKM